MLVDCCHLFNQCVLKMEAEELPDVEAMLNTLLELGPEKSSGHGNGGGLKLFNIFCCRIADLALCGKARVCV